MTQKPKRAFRIGLAATLLGAVPGTAQAAKIEVSPVVIEMPAGMASTVLTVTNRGADRTSVQVRSFAWSQTATTDPLQPTSTLMVSPPIFELGAGETQTVRILLRQPASGAEASYRLLVDELPTPGAPSTIQFPLRLSLPLFAEPRGAAAPDLSWRIASAGGASALVAQNRGNKRERVSDLAVALPGGPARARTLENAWVLPGAERRYALPQPASGTMLRVSGRSEQGPVDVAAPVQRD